MRTVAMTEDFAVSAVRYALGRRTYIVSLTVDEIIRVWDSLGDRVHSVIRCAVVLR